MGKKLRTIENNIKRTRDVLAATGQFRNCVKTSKGQAEGISQKVIKAWIAWWCEENGLNYYTEATLRTGKGRIDILVEEWCVAFEILSTEDEKRFLEKNYPITTVPVLAETPVVEILAMLEDIWSTNGAGAEYYAERHTRLLGKRKRSRLAKTIKELTVGRPLE